MATRGWENWEPPLSTNPGKNTGKHGSPGEIAKETARGTTSTNPGILGSIGEYRFHPTRKWRFDYAWPDRKVALEVQGGLFVNGRHSRGAALLKEHEKLNTAAQLGWRVLFCTPQQIGNGEAIDIVQKALSSGSTDRERR